MLENYRISSDKLFAQIEKLKQEFNIIPNIESLDDLKLNFNKKVKITHKDCGYEEEVTLKNWISTKRSSTISVDKNSLIHFCSKCLNKLKKENLQNYLNENYNSEFLILGEYKGFHEKIEIKHIYCEDSFFKSPSEMKSKLIYCKHCGKTDLLHEKEISDKKNAKMYEKFKENNVKDYIPLEDCLGLTKKIKFKHITCGSEFIATPYDIYNNYHKHNHCPNCFKKQVRKGLTGDLREKQINASLRNKHRRFTKFSKEFIFSPEIGSFENFKETNDKLFTITHKKCGRSVEMHLDKWSKNRSCFIEKTENDEFTYLCPHCSEEIARKNLQEYLDKNYNREYLIVGKYANAKKPILIKHKKCGETFTIRPDAMKVRSIRCRVCRNLDKKTESNIQSKKNKNLKKLLKKHGFTNYIPLEDVDGLTKPMKFKHSRCGSVITVVPQILFRSKYKRKIYCSECPEELIDKTKDLLDRTKYAQQAINIVNSSNNFTIVGQYDDSEETITLSHNKCSGEFIISKKHIFSKETKCPHCETKNFKNNKFISINEKVKQYEKILDDKYEILKPFIDEEETVPIKHKECGHIFNRTITSFMRSKGKILCPICRKQGKFNNLKEKIYNKFKDEYSVHNINIYKNVRTPITFKHNTCNTVFEATFDKMLSCKTAPCPTCNPDTKTIDTLKSEMYEKFKGEYLIRGEFEGYTKKMSFKHKKCGRVFFRTPHDLLTIDIPCTHCLKESKLVGLKEAQRRVDEKSNGLFTLNGIYRGVKKDIPVTCNKCGHVFMSTPKKMFNRISCPSCKEGRKNKK